ncbi:hypothetical protein [Polaromonas sp.]|uniref:aldose epimerase family protein n=1 Tax=Polaromonas sp. TaxID=1869339 RepID=UPI003566DD3E
MRPDDQIKLACGAYSARVSAAAGARMTALTWNDGHRERDLLVPFDGDTAFDPHAWPKTGAFPMAPFTNKLAHGSFSWSGREVNLPTPPETPHAMHGHAHRVAWTLSHASSDRAILRHLHEPDREGWPWRFDLTLEIEVSESGVQVDLQIRNLSESTMPASIGWHPFHPATGLQMQERPLMLAAAAHHDVGSDGLKVRLPARAQDLAVRHHLVIDDLGPQTTIFEGWAGRFTLPLEQDLEIDVQSTGADLLFCHVPPHAQHVCLEPVTAMPGALQTYDARLRALHLSLKPDEARAIRWRCSARSRSLSSKPEL